MICGLVGHLGVRVGEGMIGGAGGVFGWRMTLPRHVLPMSPGSKTCYTQPRNQRRRGRAKIGDSKWRKKVKT